MLPALSVLISVGRFNSPPVLSCWPAKFQPILPELSSIIIIFDGTKEPVPSGGDLEKAVFEIENIKKNIMIIFFIIEFPLFV